MITSNNKPVAALVSLKDADRESIALGLSPEFGSVVRRARAEAKKGKVFSLKQVKEELLGEPARPHKVVDRRRLSSTRKRVSSRRG